jgi:putative flippase GtrA
MKFIIDLIKLTYNRFRNLILYGIIGAISASVDFMIFFTLTNYFCIYYLVANFISVLIGINLSFVLNKTYNFKTNDKLIKRYLIFVSVGFSGLLLSSLILYLTVDLLLIDKNLSKFLSIILVVFVQFLINKYITFKKEVL